MRRIIRRVISDFVYVFLNYFVASIPAFWIRRLFYLACGMKIGKGSRIAMKVTVFSPWGIVIGENSMINEYTILDGRGGVKIGNNVSVSMYSVIYSASHKTHSDTFEYYQGAVVIEDNVWLGVRATVLPDSTIRKGSIIAANSSFTGETATNGIYSGVPAKQVSDRRISDNYSLGLLTYFFK